MCGISGTYAMHAERTVSLSKEHVRISLEKMRHRGPDVSSVKEFESCILGHNRLKILDLSSEANQPMEDASGRYTIVFNGEIFNHIELRISLEKTGVVFLTHSDTEVLLHLLIQKKTEALHLLNGFFAFAFYDNQTHELIAARDRFGEKPLWYFHDEQHLHLASELKGLLSFNVPKEIDSVSLSLFLQFTYIPGPQSIYKNVFKLEPGHLLLARPGKLEKQKWYHPTFTPIEEKSRPRVYEQLNKLMQESVEIRMQADVKVGCFLSGGADSSIVSMLAAANHPQLPTYSIAFTDQPFLDETLYAQEVSKHIGSKHEVIPLTTNNLFEEIMNVWNHFDEPFADSSAIAVSLLSSVVKQELKVALSGDGADEIFGGYNKYVALNRSMQSSLPNKLIPQLLPLFELFPSGRHSALSNRIRQILRFGRGLELPLKERFIYWSSWSDEMLSELLVTQDLSVRKGARINSFVQDISSNDFNSILLADQHLVLTNDMLTKVDMMSMKHSLEVRAPFLDHRVVEFANALPSAFKCDAKNRKIILKEVFQNRLPDSVFSRPKKGFEVPLERWLRKEMKDLIFELLSPEKLTTHPYLKKGIVKQVLDSFYTKKNSDLTYLVYSLAVFEHWYRRSQAE